MALSRRACPSWKTSLLPLITGLVGWLPTALAQTVAVSSTAAWSSQIVAFWGAVSIGVRSSNGLQSGNGFTSILASISAFWRARAAMSALHRGEWYVLSPGYNGGSTRLDVVLVCWSNSKQLWQACLKVAMLTESVGRQKWLVLVVGRQLRQRSTTDVSGCYWTHSPRHHEYCLTRFADPAGGAYSAFTDEQLVTYSVQYSTITDNITITSSNMFNGANNSSPAQGHITGANNSNHNVDDKADVFAMLLCEVLQQRPTRCTTRNEAPHEVQESASIGRHVTSYQMDGVVTPYVSVQKLRGALSVNRQGVVRSAVSLYCIVHMIVCMAVGLMGAASGRGLTVWLFSPRMVMAKLGAEVIAGDDTLLSLASFHKVKYQYSSEAGNAISLASDAFLPCIHQSKALLSVALNVLELLLVIGGWLYGALKVEKLPPSGLVGHGMLALAVLVSTGLSLRTIYSLQHKVSARLIGIFHEPYYIRHVLAKDCRIKFTASTPAPSPSPAPSLLLRLVSDVLSKTEDDTISMTAALSLMRHPMFCLQVSQHAASNCLKYSYEGDTLASEGDKKVTTAGEYPWFQICLCACMTFLCSVFGAVYAYVNIMPRWSKLVAEVFLATSAVWFATLARTSKLEHSHSTEICHMVATMVASAVWYVGVKDVG